MVSVGKMCCPDHLIWQDTSVVKVNAMYTNTVTQVYRNKSF